MSRARSFALALLTASIVAASPAQADPDNACHDGMFSDPDGLGVAAIGGRPGTRVPFQLDREGGTEGEAGRCPSLSECSKALYLLPGDRVLTARKFNDFTCVWYQGRMGDAAGWVPTASLRKIPIDPHPPGGAWTGDWIDGNNAIRIRRTGKGQLKIIGAAELRWFSINVADVSATVAVPGTRSLRFRDDRSDNGDCGVQLTWLSGFLIVHDTGQCGGANVSFDGIYTRR